MPADVLDVVAVADEQVAAPVAVGDVGAAEQRRVGQSVPWIPYHEPSWSLVSSQVMRYAAWLWPLGSLKRYAQ